LSYCLIFEDLHGANSNQPTTNTLPTLSNNSTTAVNKPGIQVAQEARSYCIYYFPIVPAQTSTPKVYNSSSSNSKISGDPKISSILSDFETSVSPSKDYRRTITYTHPREYRLIDMYSAYSLNKIDFVGYWKDISGSLNPLYLQQGCNANVKLFFRRKHFYFA
jgi:hypothetical protein